MGNPVGVRKEGVALALETGLMIIIRICFVVGILAVLLLYFLFGRGAAGRKQDWGAKRG